jgi:hypothetical protein
MFWKCGPMGDGENGTARTGGAWGSTLRVGDFAAIRSVGFEPVGQAFGAAVSLAPAGHSHRRRHRVHGSRHGGAGDRLPAAASPVRR